MPRKYITRQGDMWDSIAFHECGSEYAIKELLKANPKHIHTLVFSKGVELVIPDIQTKRKSVLPPWRR